MGTMRRTVSAFAVAAGLVGLLGGARPALAHEAHAMGDLELVIGFGTEPAYAGMPNSVQVLVRHDGEPVTNLRPGDLRVEVTYGDATSEFELEPFFRVGVFGEPGDYRAWFVPSQPGDYTFHVMGRVEGERVDTSVTSGPDTFSPVIDPVAEAFPPVQAPTNAELAERLEREASRSTEAIARANDAAAAATDAAASARTIGVLGTALGAAGLAVGGAALLRRRTAG
jgi:hypothetical protein